jgi:hypothetical protein
MLTSAQHAVLAKDPNEMPPPLAATAAAAAAAAAADRAGLCCRTIGVALQVMASLPPVDATAEAIWLITLASSSSPLGLGSELTKPAFL